jgi:type IV pilus assembly protein PilY1
VQTTDSAPSPDGNKPCEERPWLIGDIFHSDPIVVRNPPARTFGSAYDAFRTNYLDRDRIIYTGTNGGFLEGFHAGAWNSGTQLYDEGTGVEKFGFMPWEPRTRIKRQPIDPPTARAHYVDGAPQVADAWLYSTSTVATQAASEWRTILAAGLREGGRHYYALDCHQPLGRHAARRRLADRVSGDPVGVAERGRLQQDHGRHRLRLDRTRATTGTWARPGASP